MILFKLFILIGFLACNNPKVNTVNSSVECFAPNEEIAIGLAKAICIPIIGKEAISRTEYKAKLINGEIWKVTGDSHSEKGGIIIIEINKNDCKVLNFKMKK